MELSNRINEELNKIELPQNIDRVIMEAVKKGQRERKRKEYIKRFIISAAACMIVFAVSINMIPTFADNLERIPVISKFIGFVTLDKGLEGARDNGLGVQVNRSSENKNVNMSVDNVFSDGRNIVMMIRTKLVNEKATGTVMPMNYTITDDKGNVLLRSSFRGSSMDSKLRPDMMYAASYKNNTEILNVFYFIWTDSKNAMPSKMKLNCTDMVVTKLTGVSSAKKNEHKYKEIRYPGKWEISFNIKNEKSVKPVSYDNLKVKTYDGSSYKIHMNSYPLMSDIHIARESGKKYYLEFYLVDQNGTIYRDYGQQSDKNAGVYNCRFESAYYSPSSSLYLVAKFAPVSKQSKIILNSLIEYNRTKPYDKNTGSEIFAIDSKGNRIMRDKEGNVLWKEPINTGVYFKVKIK